MLFVSGTTTGGSAASTHELAQVLAARGNQVGILARRRAHPRAGLVAPTPMSRVGGLAALPARAWRSARRATLTKPASSALHGDVHIWTSAAPDRVLPFVQQSFRPDVVIVNSVPRNAWRSMRASLQRVGVPAVLYVREAATLEQVPIVDLRPDLTVANCEALQRVVVALGVPACYVPSVIDFDQCEIVSTREVVLFVNPVETRGLSIALALAADNPGVRFAFQLSWPLGRRDERALRDEIGAYRNIELREYEPCPARIYRDARALLLPYLVDQRPRVVAEAQHNGIPVLASDLLGHREAVGPGGMFVAVDAARDAWSAALRTLLDDATSRELGDAARAHARRADQDAEHIAEQFENLMRTVASGDARV